MEMILEKLLLIIFFLVLGLIMAGATSANVGSAFISSSGGLLGLVAFDALKAKYEEKRVL